MFILYTTITKLPFMFRCIYSWFLYFKSKVLKLIKVMFGKKNINAFI